LESKVSDIEHDLKGKYESNLEEAKTKFNEAKAKLGNLVETADEAWEDVKDGLEIAWDGLKLGITTAISEFENNKEPTEKKETDKSE
jgi:hypothetical protein